MQLRGFCTESIYFGVAVMGGRRLSREPEYPIFLALERMEFSVESSKYRRVGIGSFKREGVFFSQETTFALI